MRPVRSAPERTIRDPGEPRRMVARARSSPYTVWMNAHPMEAAGAGAEELSRHCCECIESCEDAIRREPWLSVLVAMGIGFLLHVLPVGKILSALAGAVMMLAKPALIVFGLVKLASYLGRGPAEPKTE